MIDLYYCVMHEKYSKPQSVATWRYRWYWTNSSSLSFFQAFKRKTANLKAIKWKNHLILSSSFHLTPIIITHNNRDSTKEGIIQSHHLPNLHISHNQLSSWMFCFFKSAKCQRIPDMQFKSFTVRCHKCAQYSFIILVLTEYL